MLGELLAGSILPNLFDTHPPFQIDGNFGATAGIAEMLLQSHCGEVHLLPALPAAWPDGRVQGLRARGGCGVAAATGKAAAFSRRRKRASAGGKCKVRYGQTVRELSLAANEARVLDAALRPVGN